MSNSVAAQSKRGSKPHNNLLSQDDLRCMTVPQWAELCGFSTMTGKRLLRAGKGPRLIQLSTKRVGVRVIDAKQWLESRARS
jgi:predicted DNA-binding transcriptional regulator AlpA